MQNPNRGVNTGNCNGWARCGDGRKKNGDGESRIALEMAMMDGDGESRITGPMATSRQWPPCIETESDGKSRSAEAIEMSRHPAATDGGGESRMAGPVRLENKYEPLRNQGFVNFVQKSILFHTKLLEILENLVEHIKCHKWLSYISFFHHIYKGFRSAQYN